MYRSRALSLAGAALLALAVSAPTIAAIPAAQAGEWHRNNYNAGEEQLSCDQEHRLSAARAPLQGIAAARGALQHRDLGELGKAFRGQPGERSERADLLGPGPRERSGHALELEHQVVLQHARPMGPGGLLDLEHRRLDLARLEVRDVDLGVALELLQLLREHHRAEVARDLGEVAFALGVPFLPTTIIADTDGRLRYRVTGEIDTATLRRLLGEVSGSS